MSKLTDLAIKKLAMRKEAGERYDKIVGAIPRQRDRQDYSTSYDISENPYLSALFNYGAATKDENTAGNGGEFVGVNRPLFGAMPTTPGYLKPMTVRMLEAMRRRQADLALPDDPNMTLNEANDFRRYMIQNGRHHRDLFNKGKLNTVKPEERELPIPEHIKRPSLRDAIKKHGPYMAYNGSNIKVVG
jgi:hypothetical protein